VERFHARAGAASRDSLRRVTFSIVAADPPAGEIGVAVQSRFLAVGAVVPWARAGVGAVATQALAEVSFGPRGLDLLAEGLAPQEVLDRLLAGDVGRDERQVGVVGATGVAASYTGPACFEHAGSVTGDGFACQGNILGSADVVPEMARAFQASTGRRLAERLVEALRAGQGAGGDRRGQQSAALLVVKPGGSYGGTTDRYIDLRVDDHERPIDELARLLELHRFYFEHPDGTDIVEVDAALEEEIAGLLRRAGRLDAGIDTWEGLRDHMGWENLEERWVGPGRIDRVVLEHLRRQDGP
jgi:uncharacterized Ntn-hydrolase superfamily protein